MVPDFPNLFNVTGPGSPSVLANTPVPIEQHLDWIIDCIAHCQASGIDTIEAEEDAARNWVDHVREAAFETLLPQAGNIWYRGANMPCKPRIFMFHADGMVRDRKICDKVTEKDYTSVVLGCGGTSRMGRSVDYSGVTLERLGV